MSHVDPPLPTRRELREAARREEGGPPLAVETATPDVSSPVDVPLRRERARELRSRKVPPSSRAPRNRTGSLLREMIVVVVVTLVVSFVLKTFFVQSFSIPSESMQDTLDDGDRILVSKLAPGPLDVHRGDIVVFEDQYDWLNVAATSDTKGNVVTRTLAFIGLMPDNTTGHLVKRVIGLPGDRVECRAPGGPIYLNGVAIDETGYLKPGSSPSELVFDVTVPSDSVFVMGDNRQHSSDSRRHMGDPNGGFVPMANIVGVAQLRTWPVNRWAVLRNPGEVFAAVPDPATTDSPASNPPTSASASSTTGSAS